MTMVEAVGMVGKEADLRTADFMSVRVRIMDAKQAYGSFRFVVTPVSGQGAATVDASRLSRIGV